MSIKAILVQATLALACAAGAQTYFHGNPSIVQPKSGEHVLGHGHTNYLVNVARSLGNGSYKAFVGLPGGYTPAQVKVAYGMPTNGGGQAIAIIDAFDDPYAQQEFNTFAAEYGLAQEPSGDITRSTNVHFQVVYAGGSRPNPNSAWAGEAALDFEWAHAMAPNAKIYLVEAASDYNTDLEAAVGVAVSLPGVREVSMSWGIDEYQSETDDDSTFFANGVTFFSAAGDSSNAPDYPAVAPNVVGVGGTSLQLANSGAVISQTAWNMGGGGPSVYENRPAFQNGIAGIVGSARGAPDVAADADPNTGVPVYSAYDPNGWDVDGGTSLSTVLAAAIANDRGYYDSGSADMLDRIYAGMHNSLYGDVNSGSSGMYSAARGWDYVTGYGDPIGTYQPHSFAFVPALIEIAYGYFRSGNLASLAAVDDNTYTIGTIQDGAYQTGSVQINYTVDRDPYKFLYLSLSLTMSAASGSILDLYAYNFATARYDYVAAFNTTASLAPYTLAIPYPMDHVNANRHVQLFLKSYTKRTSAYWFQIDQAKIGGYAIQ